MKSKVGGKEKRAMPPSKAERKEQLMRTAEELIDRMLAEEKPASEIMFEDIEQAALRVGQGLQAEIVAEATVGAERGEDIKCPSCGKRMAYQGLRSRPMVSAAGEVTIQRGYYYCRMCKVGSFPPR
jgi:hypothetical protein